MKITGQQLRLRIREALQQGAADRVSAGTADADGDGDRDGDGDADFDDVRIARYLGGGMTPADALARVRRVPLGG